MLTVQIILSLLKARKVTVIGIECDDAALEGLEGDRGRDIVQWCHLLTSFQEGPHQKLFFQGKNIFCKQDGKLYYSRICQVSYVITGKLLASHFLFLFSFTKIWSLDECLRRRKTTRK